MLESGANARICFQASTGSLPGEEIGLGDSGVLGQSPSGHPRKKRGMLSSDCLRGAPGKAL
jgi:hypothetical protein